MAIQGFPFTSVAGDRTYGAADFASYQDVLNGAKSGVVSGLLNELAVTSLGSYQTQINTGGAVFTGYVFRSTSTITQTHDAVASGSKRYDLVVFTLDSVTTRQFSASIVKGTATTGTAVVPSAGAYDTVLATLYINNTSGTPAYTVTDSRTYLGLPVSATQFASIVDAQYPASNLLTKLKTVDGSGSALLAEGVQTSQITDMNFDPTALGMAVGETRILYSTYQPSNRPAGGNYYTVIITCSLSGIFYVNAFRSSGEGIILQRLYSSSAWSSWVTYQPYRTYNGGSVSGTVTLPSIEIGETMTAWYNVTASATIKTPATGTFNTTMIVQNGSNCTYATAGGVTIINLSTANPYCFTYTRTA